MAAAAPAEDAQKEHATRGAMKKFLQINDYPTIAEFTGSVGLYFGRAFTSISATDAEGSLKDINDLTIPTCAAYDGIKEEWCVGETAQILKTPKINLAEMFYYDAENFLGKDAFYAIEDVDSEGEPSEEGPKLKAKGKTISLVDLTVKLFQDLINSLKNKYGFDPTNDHLTLALNWEDTSQPDMIVKAAESAGLRVAMTLDKYVAVAQNFKKDLNSLVLILDAEDTHYCPSVVRVRGGKAEMIQSGCPQVSVSKCDQKVAKATKSHSKEWAELRCALYADSEGADAANPELKKKYEDACSKDFISIGKKFVYIGTSEECTTNVVRAVGLSTWFPNPCLKKIQEKFASAHLEPVNRTCASDGAALYGYASAFTESLMGGHMGASENINVPLGVAKAEVRQRRKGYVDFRDKDILTLKPSSVGEALRLIVRRGHPWHDLSTMRSMCSSMLVQEAEIVSKHSLRKDRLAYLETWAAENPLGSLQEAFSAAVQAGYSSYDLIMFQPIYRDLEDELRKVIARHRGHLSTRKTKLTSMDAYQYGEDILAAHQRVGVVYPRPGGLPYVVAACGMLMNATQGEPVTLVRIGLLDLKDNVAAVDVMPHLNKDTASLPDNLRRPPTAKFIHTFIRTLNEATTSTMVMVAENAGMGEDKDDENHTHNPSSRYPWWVKVISELEDLWAVYALSICCDIGTEVNVVTINGGEDTQSLDVKCKLTEGLHQLLRESRFKVMKDAPQGLGVYHPAMASASSKRPKETISQWSGHLETLAGAAATEEFKATLAELKL